MRTQTQTPDDPVAGWLKIDPSELLWRASHPWRLFCHRLDGKLTLAQHRFQLGQVVTASPALGVPVASYVIIRLLPAVPSA
jgi:hypothetical protein